MALRGQEFTQVPMEGNTERVFRLLRETGMFEDLPERQQRAAATAFLGGGRNVQPVTDPTTGRITHFIRTRQFDSGLEVLDLQGNVIRQPTGRFFTADIGMGTKIAAGLAAGAAVAGVGSRLLFGSERVPADVRPDLNPDNWNKIEETPKPEFMKLFPPQTMVAPSGESNVPQADLLFRSDPEFERATQFETAQAQTAVPGFMSLFPPQTPAQPQFAQPAFVPPPGASIAVLANIAAGETDAKKRDLLIDEINRKNLANNQGKLFNMSDNFNDEITKQREAMLDEPIPSYGQNPYRGILPQINNTLVL